MDFIERLFGFSPDGGSGSLELLFFALPVTVAVFIALGRARRSRRRLCGGVLES